VLPFYQKKYIFTPMRIIVLVIIILFLTACKEKSASNSVSAGKQTASEEQKPACYDCVLVEEGQKGLRVEKHYKEGRIEMTLENHAKNRETIVREWDKKRYVPNNKAYCKTYHSNGSIKGEGWLLWNEGENPNSYLSVEYGTWKFYNDKGTLINIRDYYY
jgi:hypothetical protein